jgi:hypothetical protein
MLDEPPSHSHVNVFLSFATSSNPNRPNVIVAPSRVVLGGKFTCSTIAMGGRRERIAPSSLRVIDGEAVMGGGNDPLVLFRRIFECVFDGSISTSRTSQRMYWVDRFLLPLRFISTSSSSLSSSSDEDDDEEQSTKSITSWIAPAPRLGSFR